MQVLHACMDLHFLGLFLLALMIENLLGNREEKSVDIFILYTIYHEEQVKPCYFLDLILSYYGILESGNFWVSIAKEGFNLLFGYHLLSIYVSFFLMLGFMSISTISSFYDASELATRILPNIVVLVMQVYTNHVHISIYIKIRIWLAPHMH